MKRDIDLKEISDGKLYTANDMVKADCHDCVGCSACCSGMGESIVLDPYDIHQLCKGLQMDFQGLLNQYIELNMVDGLILPNLKMSGAKEQCGFLNQEGRCSIHAFRPGICRMFPLGRVYGDEGFQYFLQIHECPVANKGKVKVKKWLEIPDLKGYERYITLWHGFLKDCEQQLQELTEEQLQVLTMFILRSFYQTPYGTDFFAEFDGRLNQVRGQLNLDA